MAENDEFANRIAKINKKSRQKTAPTPPARNGRGGAGAPRGNGLFLRIGVPLVFAGVLGFLFLDELTETTPVSVLTSDNALAASIKNRMSDKDIEEMNNDPWINKELKSRNYTDPDMARLLLSH